MTKFDLAATPARVPLFRRRGGGLPAQRGATNRRLEARNEGSVVACANRAPCQAPQFGSLLRRRRASGSTPLKPMAARNASPPLGLQFGGAPAAARRADFG
jgi:hypothetical protein